MKENLKKDLEETAKHYQGKKLTKGALNEYDVLVPFRGVAMLHIVAPKASIAIKGARELVHRDLYWLGGNLTEYLSLEHEIGSTTKGCRNAYVTGYVPSDELEVGEWKGEFKAALCAEDTENNTRFDAKGRIINA